MRGVLMKIKITFKHNSLISCRRGRHVSSEMKKICYLFTVLFCTHIEKIHVLFVLLYTIKQSKFDFF